MQRLSSGLVNSLILAAALGTSVAAVAAGDMLEPNELQTTGISANPANDSSWFVGAGLGFGQGRTTEPDASPGLAYLASFEPGYQFNTGNWSRLEVSGQVFSGSLGYHADDRGGKVTMPVNFGFLAKIGYGYSLGSKLFGIVRIGAGPVQARWRGDDYLNGSVESVGVLNGLATEFAYSIVAPITDSIDVTGGFSYMHMEFDLNKVKTGGLTASFNHPVVVNVPQAEIGLRLRI